MDELIRRVQRVAGNRPDTMHILAETISLIGESDVDPYAVLGVHTLIQHIPPERQADTAATLLHLLRSVSVRMECAAANNDIEHRHDPRHCRLR